MIEKFKNQKAAKFVASAFLLALIGISIFFISRDNAEPKDYSVASVSMAPGSDETQYNFSWLTSDDYSSGVIEFAKREGRSGDTDTQQVEADVKKADGDFIENEATISGLEPSTVYSYRLGNGKGSWTETKSFKTQDIQDFSFLLIGDPQIGSSGDIESDVEGWTDTLKKGVSMYPDSSFIQSAGDQVENADSKEEYSGFFTPQILEEIPLAATVGNHDDGVLYRDYFNMPNQSEELGETDVSPGNYYFTYGNTLIMNLNTNSNDVEEHTQFMEETIAATENLDLKWKLIVLHHSIYSVGGHANEQDVLALREGLVPAIDELEIDAVLMGHDHSYARTYHMKNFMPLKNQKYQDGAVINPKGTLYLTVNSSSGSKYYSLSRDEEPYAVVKEQWEVPTFTNVEVTNDSLELSTYRTDTMELADSYKIIKDESIKVELPGFESANLTATGNVLPTEPSEFYPEVLVAVNGVNTEGGPFDIPYENIEYKTVPEGQISIDKEGEVTVQEGADPGKVELWAEIEVDGEKTTTDKIEIELIEHEEKELVTQESTWRYLDDGSDQKSDWQETEFDDSEWKTGKAPLGYPEDESRPTFEEIETVVDFGEDEEEKFATTYFRTEFEIEDASSIGNLGYIEFEVDDSLILFLNGTEISRFNLPEGEIKFDNYLYDITDNHMGDESVTEKIYLNEEQLENLKEGKNVLAAEVHQDRADSSDLYWAMKFVTN